MSLDNRVVLLPSFNSGRLLRATAQEALRFWPRVIVVLDGSRDESVGEIIELAAREEGLRVLHLPRNMGKGAAVLEGLRAAGSASHALVMDADGQHPADRIPAFFQASEEFPTALVAGMPIFGPDAPKERVWGRRIGNTFARIETLGRGPLDSLFGFRVYPVEPTLRVLEKISWGRRFDFDTVVAVRLSWAGVPVLNLPARVVYPPREEGGVTQFRYFRDNALLATAHTRLLLGMLARLPRLLSSPGPGALQTLHRARGGAAI